MRAAAALALFAAAFPWGGHPTAHRAAAIPIARSAQLDGPGAQEAAVLEANPGAPDSTPVVVASKPFGESYLLAEMFAQLLEARGFEADRRLGLGATEIAFQALRTGAVDIYPEYTGTGLLAILGEEPRGDARSVFRRVAENFRERWDARWLLPLGFENTYAVAVRRVRNLSDLAREGGGLVAGLSPDFIGREDGLPGLRAVYGFEPAEVRALLQAVKYQALAASEVDVIDGYSTDGAISRYDLVVLEDDLGFFPPYEAAGLVNGSFWRRRPDAVAALSEISGLLDESRVRGWNRRVEVDGDAIADVARDALSEIGLVASERTADGAERTADDVGLAAYMWQNRSETLRLSRRHMLLVLVSLAGAVLLAVPRRDSCSKGRAKAPRARSEASACCRRCPASLSSPS